MGHTRSTRTCSVRSCAFPSCRWPSGPTRSATVARGGGDEAQDRPYTDCCCSRVVRAHWPLVPGAYLPRMLSTKEKDASKKAQSAQTASPHCRYNDGQARSPGQLISLSLSPSRVRPGTILSHAMHFLSARTRTCRLSVHALRAMAQRRRLRGTRAVIDVHCMCRCCPSAHCACQPHHRPAPTAVAVRRSRCCMVACVHAVHTGLTPLRASRQRPIGKAKRRRGQTG